MGFMDLKKEIALFLCVIFFEKDRIVIIFDHIAYGLLGMPIFRSTLKKILNDFCPLEHS